MITAQELSALAQILNRVPMTQAEALWVQSLMDKLGAMMQPSKSKGSKKVTEAEKDV